MSQHDQVIANADGATVRADINAALAALFGTSSGATAPATTVAYQFWADTANDWLKQRNAANSAWVEVFRLSDIAFKDSTFALVDNGDTTKKLVLQLSSITPGTTRTLTCADESGTVALIGVKQQIGYWPAAAIKPQTTNGCAALAWDESTTNKVLTGHLAFDAAAIEYAQFSFRAPAALDESSNFIVMFDWTEASGATSHDCVWQVEMQAQGDADTIDSAWGTAVTVTDTGTSGTRRMTAQTSAVTPGGTWAAGDEIIVRVSRKATDAADTLNVDAKLCGVALFATYAVSTEP